MVESSVLDNALTFDKGGKYITYGDKCALDFKNDYHEQVYQSSIGDNQEAFFDKEAQNIHWHKKYTQILDKSD